MSSKGVAKKIVFFVILIIIVVFLVILFYLGVLTLISEFVQKELLKWEIKPRV